MKTFDAPIKIRSKSDLKIFFIPNHTKLRTRKRVHPRPTSNLASISVLPQFLELTSFKKNNIILLPILRVDSDATIDVGIAKTS